MEFRVVLLFALAFGLVGRLSAAPLSVVGPPASTYADTEVSTNVPFAAWEARMKRFEFALSFDATPSNNVQAAFGRDLDADGVLGPDEEDVVVGWDCGEWFVRCVTNGAQIVSGPVSANRAQTLSVVLGTRVSDTRMKSFAAAADGVALFPALAAELPAWLYDPSWNLLRLTARGAGDPAARLRVQTVPEGFTFIFR